MFQSFLVVPLLLVLAAHSAIAVEMDLPNPSLSVVLGDADRNSLPGATLAHEEEMLQSLYARQAGRTLWSEQDRLTYQANELIGILRVADKYGLEPSAYGSDFIATDAGRLLVSGNSTPESWARLDLLLSRAAIRLVTHLHFGRIDPRSAGFELNVPRDDLDVVAAVAAIASAIHVSDALSSVEPKFYHYDLLKAALARYRRLQSDPTLTKLPNFGRRSLHAGDTYIGAPALRKLLSVLGDMSLIEMLPAVDEQMLDPALIDALKSFQDRHGISADGVLGTKTFAALTTPMAQRVRQIELTLERWRWLPPLATPPIIVNIPQFRLFAFRTIEDRAASIMQMDVIVGQAYRRTRTPVFLSDMKYVIFRPYWDVPRSITNRELLPKIRTQANYLRKNNFEIVRGESDDSTVVNPTPMAIDALAAGKLRLRQRPGDDNALGLIKFIFPNAHNVFMHSTPAHQLFQQSRRAFSHGCIRVSDPVALATYVLHNAALNWDNERIVAAMNNTDNSVRVELPKPIRVMILYGTVQASEAGPIRFFDDIYGHDRKLESLLGLKPVYSSAAPR